MTSEQHEHKHPEQAGEVSTTPSADPAPALTIVSLDDDADFRQYIAQVLEDQGHDVRTVATKTDLFEAIAERMPDIVLMDMKMGPTTGERVLAELRERWARLCVIVVTGYPSLNSMRQTFKQDVFDYLAKPFSTDELAAVLAQAATALNLGQQRDRRLRLELGKQIRLARTQRGWTLKELSDAAKLSVSQLSSIERGAHLPSLDSLLFIADAFGASVSCLCLAHVGKGLLKARFADFPLPSICNVDSHPILMDQERSNARYGKNGEGQRIDQCWVCRCSLIVLALVCWAGQSFGPI
jgi:CheY-like chemotaxis protein/transcriptional regulator with XRE-family HTH domain